MKLTSFKGIREGELFDVAFLTVHWTVERPQWWYIVITLPWWVHPLRPVKALPVDYYTWGWMLRSFAVCLGRGRGRKPRLWSWVHGGPLTRKYPCLS